MGRIENYKDLLFPVVMKPIFMHSGNTASQEKEFQ